MSISQQTSSKPGLSIRPSRDGLAGVLRVDEIRLATLVDLVSTWSEDGAQDDVVTQLEALSEAVQAPGEGELDRLSEIVEEAAAMGTAEIRISTLDLLRLRDEIDAAINATSGRFNPKALSDRRAS